MKMVCYWFSLSSHSPAADITSIVILGFVSFDQNFCTHAEKNFLHGIVCVLASCAQLRRWFFSHPYLLGLYIQAIYAVAVKSRTIWLNRDLYFAYPTLMCLAFCTACSYLISFVGPISKGGFGYC